jgi:hypothetical protein
MCGFQTASHESGPVIVYSLAYFSRVQFSLDREIAMRSLHFGLALIDVAPATLR